MYQTGKKCGQRFTLFCVKIELLFVTWRWCNVKSQKASGIEFIGKWTIQNVRLWQTLGTSSNKSLRIHEMISALWINIILQYFQDFNKLHMFYSLSRTSFLKKVCSHKKERVIFCRKHVGKFYEIWENSLSKIFTILQCFDMCPKSCYFVVHR